MQELEKVFLLSNFVDKETVVDVVRRIGDWLSDEDNSVDDNYIKSQIGYIEKIAKLNLKRGIVNKIQADAKIEISGLE
ncbi:hypothetical protein FL857_03310 [Criibacterium bergeronii]|uniref:DUF6877 domain-containing protein n=1 Tax=Criibacterium bergeronii TaxID=1871336 RepID=A0A552VC27_9FIRM|nr:DUF6877 family protein [Criibacterium bergeronii]TRW28032.1 hypothetical protein FL857_03310 [Criibacterium bergeronii]